jgi:hypothetical protein
VDQHTKDNWKKIKAHLEKVGQTDNMFYKRATAIMANQKDPLEEPPSLTIEDPEEL